MHMRHCQSSVSFSEDRKVILPLPIHMFKLMFSCGCLLVHDVHGRLQCVLTAEIGEDEEGCRRPGDGGAGVLARMDCSPARYYIQEQPTRLLALSHSNSFTS
jgi:hypothetical protein